MRKFILILTLFFAPLWARAAACTGSAQCVSEQFSGGSGSNVTSVSIPMSPNNTSGNTIIWLAYAKCGSAILSTDVTSTDSNGNTYNSQLQTGSSPATASGLGYFVGWTQGSPIISGANTVTLAVHRSDCQIVAGVWEYAGIYTYNPLGGIVVNGNWFPFTGFGSTASFPINASATWVPPNDSNLAFVVAVHDSGNTGTWSNTSGWANAGQFSGSGALQMAAWDATDSSAPSTINVGNTGGSSYSQATGVWLILNRQSSPPAYSATNVCAVGIKDAVAASLACPSITVAKNDVLIADTTGQGTSFANPALSACGTDVWRPWYMSYGGGSGVLWFLVSNSAQTCTPALSWPTGTNTVVLTITKYAGLAPHPIERNVWGQMDVNPLVVTTFPVVTQGTSDVMVLLTMNGGYGGGTTATGWARDNSVYLTGSGSYNGAVDTYHKVVSPGSYTQSIATVGGNWNGAYGYLVLRTADPPAPASLQEVVCSASGATTQSCALPQIETPGNTVRVHGMANDVWFAAPPTDVDGWTFLQGPGKESAAAYTWSATVGSVGSVPNVVTVTSLPARNYDVVLDEVSGLQGPTPTLNPVAGNAANDLFSGTLAPTTTQTSTPIYLYQTKCATYFVDGFLNGSMSQGSNPEIFTPSAPFYTRLVPQGAHNFSGLFDGTETLCDSIDTATMTVGTVGSYKPHAYAWAWSSTRPYEYPRDLQDYGVFNAAGSVPLTLNEPTANGVLYVSANANGGPWSITSSPSLTWVPELGCGSSDKDCMWAAFSVPAGSVTVTPSSANDLFYNVVKFSGFTGVDVKQWAVSNTLSTPVSVTSSGANEFFVVSAFTNGTLTGSNNLFAGLSGTNANQNIPGFSDHNANSVYTGLAPTAMTYGGTCTADDIGGNGTGCAIILFDFTLPASTAGATMLGNAGALGNTTQQ